MKRRQIIAAAAALLLILPSCGKVTDNTVTTTEEITAEPAAEPIALIRDGATEYSVIRPEKGTDAEIANAVAFRKKLNNEFGVRFEINTDYVLPGKDPTQSYEILVGNCDRPESKAFLSALGEGGYGFSISGRKIVIAGRDDGLLAYALTAFENHILDGGLTDGSLILTDGTVQTFTGKSLSDSPTAALATQYSVTAVRGGMVCSVPKKDEYKSAQGVASDGTWFYSALTCKKSDGSQTGIIVKSPMDSNQLSLKQYSEDLPLDHANDMCYNSKENVLVITNMKGKTLTVIDPDTLQMIKQVDAEWLGGTPWAISYNASRDCYVIAAGGYLNILGSDFRSVAPGIRMGGGPSGYTGQGMDCDDDYIYMPMSPGTDTKDNIIVVYSWTDGYYRTVHMGETAESETMLNVNGEYFIAFNSSGCCVNRLNYIAVFE